MAKQITDQNFVVVVAEGLPVVIDFSAAWCGPCQKIAPIIDELAEAYAGRVNVCKCDVDDNSELAARFGVRNIPCVVFVKGCEEAGSRMVGASPKSAYAERIDQLL